MTSESPEANIRARLEQLGIAVPEEDIPFLLRSFLRQRDLLQRLAARIDPESEPAHVFKPLP